MFYSLFWFHQYTDTRAHTHQLIYSKTVKYYYNILGNVTYILNVVILILNVSGCIGHANIIIRFESRVMISHIDIK